MRLEDRYNLQVTGFDEATRVFVTSDSTTRNSPAMQRMLSEARLLDNKILRFSGELVISDKGVGGNCLSKDIDLLYHLEDDTICLRDPVFGSSVQSEAKPFLQQRRKVAGLHWTQLRVGKKILLHGKLVLLTKCSRFTQQFFAKANNAKRYQLETDWRQFCTEVNVPAVGAAQTRLHPLPSESVQGKFSNIVNSSNIKNNYVQINQDATK